MGGFLLRGGSETIGSSASTSGTMWCAQYETTSLLYMALHFGQRLRLPVEVEADSGGDVIMRPIDGLCVTTCSGARGSGARDLDTGGSGACGSGTGDFGATKVSVTGG